MIEHPNNALGADQRRFLIVSADDFGYFRCVSRGIIQAHLQGIVSATALFGNSPHLEKEVALLAGAPDLDIGIHLNLTLGEPLTSELQDKMAATQGQFPSKLKLITAVLTGAVKPAEIEAEWSCQIERAHGLGLQPCFVNSHEHVHMMPALMDVARRVAKRYQIDHIRVSAPDPIDLLSFASPLRDFALALLARRVPKSVRLTAPRFLGLAVSGRLSLAYLQRILPRLKVGQIYELMCHPGIYDHDEIADPCLTSYHDWQLELDTLTSEDARVLLNKYDVSLIGYRHLEELSANIAPNI